MICDFCGRSSASGEKLTYVTGDTLDYHYEKGPYGGGMKEWKYGNFSEVQVWFCESCCKRAVQIQEKQTREVFDYDKRNILVSIVGLLILSIALWSVRNWNTFIPCLAGFSTLVLLIWSGVYGVEWVKLQLQPDDAPDYLWIFRTEIPHILYRKVLKQLKDYWSYDDWKSWVDGRYQHSPKSAKGISTPSEPDKLAKYKARIDKLIQSGQLSQAYKESLMKDRPGYFPTSYLIQATILEKLGRNEEAFHLYRKAWILNWEMTEACEGAERVFASIA